MAINHLSLTIGPSSVVTGVAKKLFMPLELDARSWWILPPANKINAMWAREDDPASRNEEMRLIQAYSPRFVGWYGSSELCACQKKTVTAHIINTSIIQGSIIGKMPYHILRISPTSLQFLKLDNGTNSHLSREHHKRWPRRKTLLNVLPHDVPYHTPSTCSFVERYFRTSAAMR